MESDRGGMDIYIQVFNRSAFVPNIYPVLQPIVTDDVMVWLESVFNFTIFAFGVLGVITNAINLRVFAHQGVASDSNTVGLFALAMSDFLGCFTLIPYTFCEVVKYTCRAEMLRTCRRLMVLVSSSPHGFMARVTCWITVYIAVERCLCVLKPFKARIFLRPKVAIMVVTVICIFMASGSVITYSFTKLKWRLSAEDNSTLATFTMTTTGQTINKHMLFVYNTVLPASATILVAMATGMMLYKLNSYKEWREKTSSAGHNNEEKGDNSNSKRQSTGQGKRDVEVLKLVLVVTCLFLVCLSMSLIPGFAYAFIEDFSPMGVNTNLYALLFLYKFIFDAINSSLNFFFYVRISSKYKKAFTEVFSKKISKSLYQFRHLKS